ncbi:fanconi anemia group I protein homolog [Trichonephila inaurata madagascariensis]|uniref:Fanconi anemia group I protein homolog n=1 Tax=Trichonephila inaurata madagascariensis TaxID=2747483 RepID=A0A8X6XN44_9ARAC|nr:fanconi anemia group I protein homolog [Trichonephila inaurata madagascariensis]
MDLTQVLESVPIQELLQTIQKKARTGSKEVPAYIRTIFQGSIDGSDESEKRCLETFKTSLLILQMPDTSANVISDIVNILLLKVNVFHTSSLMKIAEFFVDYAKTSTSFGNKFLEIFSKVLQCLSHRDSIVYRGQDKSGTELKKDVLMSLITGDVNLSCLVELISVLKDIDLSEDEMKSLTESLLNYYYCPSKGQRQKILNGILLYFIKQDGCFQRKTDEESEGLIGNENEILYRQTEGTVILMLSVSSRHDQIIGKEFAIFIKKVQHKPELVFLPFSFAAALSLSKVQSNKDDIFESLKKSLTVAYQLKNKKNNSLWMREMIPLSPDILELVKEAIACSKFGWDHVCQGLVKFGFSVIDTFGPKYVCGNAVKSSSEEGCMLGSQILRDTFKNHRLVRSEVLEQILNQIVTKSKKPVKHYIDIFSQVVQSDPLFLLDTLPKIVEILDYIYLIPHQNAVDILQALAPLLRISMPLKDTLMLVLRKALFHRDIEARKVAVSGYLILLKKLNFIGKVSLSQSQTSTSSQASSASLISTQIKADVYVSAGNPSARTMCLEVMGLLKRVLMQQGAVRQLLYEGLHEVVLQNKNLQDIVLELLLGQFEKYYDNSDDSDVPLHFNLCFQEIKGNIVLDEPLAHLITSVHLILLESKEVTDDDEYDLSAQKMFEDFLQKLTKEMSEIDILNLQLTNKELDEASNNALQSTLILNVYESLMEYCLLQNKDFNMDNCELFLKLYRKYIEVLEAVNDKKQKKPTKFKVNITSSMHVTIRFFSTIMNGMFIDNTFKHQEGLNLFRNYNEFVIHVVKSCNQKMVKLSETGVSDGFSQVMLDLFNHILTIGHIYFKTYTEGLVDNFPSLDWERISGFFAEGLAAIFTYISTYHSKNATKFIVKICGNDSSTTTQALQIIIKSIQKSIRKLLSDTENDVNLKEIVPLLSVIKTLYGLFTNDFSEDVYKWLKQLCVQQVFQNALISKSFLSLCLTFGHQFSNILTFIREIAFDLHYHLDDIDPDERVRGSPKYNIITPEVARTVMPNLISNVDQLLEETEYVLNYMKADAFLPSEFLTSNNSTIQNMEQGVSSCLSDVVLVFHEIVQTSIPPDHISSSVFKCVTRFYRIMCTLTKYYLLRHAKSKGAVLHSTFEKLVKLTHTKLTSYVYGFITYIQMMSEESGKKKKAKGQIAALKAMREIRTVPPLVFAIETFEKNLILLSKKYKRNLVNHMKLSTARDFRINAAAIATPQETQESDTSQNTTVQNENANEENSDNDEIANEQSQPNEEAITKNKSIHDTSTRNNSISTSSVSNKSIHDEPVTEAMDVDSPEKPVQNVLKESKNLSIKRKRLGVRGNMKKAK